VKARSQEQVAGPGANGVSGKAHRFWRGTTNDRTREHQRKKMKRC